MRTVITLIVLCAAVACHPKSPPATPDMTDAVAVATAVQALQSAAVDAALSGRLGMADGRAISAWCADATDILWAEKQWRAPLKASWAAFKPKLPPTNEAALLAAIAKLDELINPAPAMK